MHIHNSMTSSISGIPYAASKEGTRDAADQEITDRVNTANRLNGKSDRAIEITESNATGDRNPDGQLPWDQFARSNQHADHSANEKEMIDYRDQLIQKPTDSTNSIPSQDQRLDFSA